MTKNATTPTIKIVVRFDGIEDEETATAIECQLAAGEMTVDDLHPLANTADALLATAIEELAERGDSTPTSCEITVEVDGVAGTSGVGLIGDLFDGDTGERIRSATWVERAASLRAGPEGHILVDGRKVFVA